MDRIHPPKTNHQFHETGPRVEPPRKKKKTKKYWRRSVAKEIKKCGTMWRETKKAANGSVLEKCCFGNDILGSTLGEEDYVKSN